MTLTWPENDWRNHPMGLMLSLKKAIIIVEMRQGTLARVACLLPVIFIPSNSYLTVKNLTWFFAMKIFTFHKITNDTLTLKFAKGIEMTCKGSLCDIVFHLKVTKSCACVIMWIIIKVKTFTFSYFRFFYGKVTSALCNTYSSVTRYKLRLGNN